jgi:omega-hydroxy-beta-dihydromenaquinone-9 sulfotransferase
MSKLLKQARVKMQRQYLDFELPKIVDTPLRWAEQILFEHTSRNVSIIKPIFIVGCHRSGTTVLYETLAKHPDLVCWTNASAFVPHMPILANRILSTAKKSDTNGVERFMKDGLKISYFTPSEGIRIWEQFSPETGDYCLDETTNNPRMEQYIKLMIRKHLKHMGGSRFLNKNPDNSVRIRYLNKLFPDALFIHILRDGRAVCNSLLKFRQSAAEFFGPEHRHATSGVKVKAWGDIQRYWREDPLYAAGLVWKEVIETLERDREFIDANRYLELRYEDFVLNPIEYLRKLTDFCQLRWDTEVEQVFKQETSKLSLGGRNEAWQKKLEPEQVNRLLEVIGSKMRQYGYEF